MPLAAPSSSNTIIETIEGVVMGAAIIAGLYYLFGPARGAAQLEEDVEEIAETFQRKKFERDLAKNGNVLQRAQYAVSDNKIINSGKNFLKKRGLIEKKWYEKWPFDCLT